MEPRPPIRKDSPRTDPCVGLVLCGGKSVRMGRDKAGLDWDGQNFLSRTSELLRPGLAEVLLAVGAERRIGLSADLALQHQVLDRKRALGPLGGLEAGLGATEERHGPAWVFVLACDMPLADRQRFDDLHQLALAEDTDGALLQWNGRDEPLFAVYHTRILKAVSQALDGGQRRTLAFLEERVLPSSDPSGGPAKMGANSLRYPRLARLSVADSDCVCNINTPRDLTRESARWNRGQEQRRGVGPRSTSR